MATLWTTHTGEHGKTWTVEVTEFRGTTEQVRITINEDCEVVIVAPPHRLPGAFALSAKQDEKFHRAYQEARAVAAEMRVAAELRERRRQAG